MPLASAAKFNPDHPLTPCSLQAEMQQEQEKFQESCERYEVRRETLQSWRRTLQVESVRFVYG